MTRHEQQRQADKAHHEGRVAWLSTERPIWACGTPVSKHEVLEMLSKSREALNYIVNHGMTTNSAAPVCWREQEASNAGIHRAAEGRPVE